MNILESMIELERYTAANGDADVKISGVNAKGLDAVSAEGGYVGYLDLVEQ